MAHGIKSSAVRSPRWLDDEFAPEEEEDDHRATRCETRRSTTLEVIHELEEEADGSVSATPEATSRSGVVLFAPQVATMPSNMQRPAPQRSKIHDASIRATHAMTHAAKAELNALCEVAAQQLTCATCVVTVALREVVAANDAALALCGRALPRHGVTCGFPVVVDKRIVGTLRVLDAKRHETITRDQYAMLQALTAVAARRLARILHHH